MLFIGMALIIGSMTLKDSFLGFIMFGVGMMIIVRSVANAVNQMQATPPTPKEKVCPPHQWDYDITNAMYCKLCKKSPGQIGSDYDKPY